MVGGAASHARQASCGEETENYDMTCAESDDSREHEDRHGQKEHEPEKVGPDITPLVVKEEQAAKAHAHVVVEPVPSQDVHVALHPLRDVFEGHEASCGCCHCLAGACCR